MIERITTRRNGRVVISYGHGECAPALGDRFTFKAMSLRGPEPERNKQPLRYGRPTEK